MKDRQDFLLAAKAKLFGLALLKMDKNAGKF